MTDLATNIRARKEAEEVVALCGNQPQRFWEALRSMCESRLPPEPAAVEKFPAMNEVQARAFEDETMPYGKFKGDAVGIVRCDYLLFLAEGDEFSQRLKCYVKSRLFSERQEDAEP